MRNILILNRGKKILFTLLARSPTHKYEIKNVQNYLLDIFRESYKFHFSRRFTRFIVEYMFVANVNVLNQNASQNVERKVVTTMMLSTI